MGIEKMRFLAPESVYWLNMNTDNETTVKQCTTCMEYQQNQPSKKAIPYQMPYKPWEVVAVNTLTVKNNILLCIVDYYSKFSVVKMEDGLLAYNLFRVVKIVFADFGLPKKIV